MALFNYATKEITLKIVYYGPGLSGKTTNLQHLHTVLNTATKGKLLSLSTEADRTLFFDFLPVELGKIRDFSIRFQLYTVPGQVRYNATRRIVLKGADAVVFVADSQREMREQNIESLDNMSENLLANNINPEEIPIVFQYNKRDLKDIASIEEMNQDLNAGSHPVVEGIAIDGTGVEEGFKLISRLLLRHISKKHRIEVEPAEEKTKEPYTEVFGEADSGGIAQEERPVPPEPLSLKEDVKSPFEHIPKKHRIEVEPVEKEKDRHASPVFEGTKFGDTLKEEPASPPEEEPLVRAEAPDYRDEAFPGSRSAVTDFRTGRESFDFRGGGNEAAPVSRESIEKITAEVRSVHEMLNTMKDSLSAVRNEIKALSEIKKAQGETNNTLRYLRDFLKDLKTSKRWFRF